MNFKLSDAYQNSFDQPNLDVNEIFRRYGYSYRKSHNLSYKQHSVMNDIQACRTGKLGYHIDSCNQCNHKEYLFNSCRNRHCPKCQGISKRKWIRARLKNILPVPYHHVVFTLPHQIYPLNIYNQKLIYDILFSSAAETLHAFAKDPKHLGAQIGFYGILHTWGQNLSQHNHLHFIVTGGGLKNNKWVEPKHKRKFLFPVLALSVVFRGKFIQKLKNAYKKGILNIPEELYMLTREEEFEKWINKLVARDWVVFSKPPFSGPEDIIQYIGRYTHKVAISNHRIVSDLNGNISFTYKDYKDNGRQKTLTLTAEEFMKRFLSHVLPDNFHRIRHYGLFSNGKCNIKIDKVRKILNHKNISKNVPEETDRIICPVCNKGLMIPVLVSYNHKIILLNNFINTT